MRRHFQLDDFKTSQSYKYLTLNEVFQLKVMGDEKQLRQIHSNSK
jgi:hypothetical protein